MLQLPDYFQATWSVNYTPKTQPLSPLQKNQIKLLAMAKADAARKLTSMIAKAKIPAKEKADAKAATTVAKAKIPAKEKADAAPKLVATQAKPNAVQKALAKLRSNLGSFSAKRGSNLDPLLLNQVKYQFIASFPELTFALKKLLYASYKV